MIENKLYNNTLMTSNNILILGKTDDIFKVQKHLRIRLRVGYSEEIIYDSDSTYSRLVIDIKNCDKRDKFIKYLQYKNLEFYEHFDTNNTKLLFKDWHEYE
jgi:hypothetical protein